MTPHPTMDARTLLQRIHDAGGELVLGTDGRRLRWVVRPPDAVALPLEQPGHLPNGVYQLLQPFNCRWCPGPAELPDGQCGRCVDALNAFAEHGGLFVLGATCRHGLRSSGIRTLCGAVTDQQDGVGLVVAREGRLCCRCVRVLITDYERSRP